MVFSQIKDILCLSWSQFIGSADKKQMLFTIKKEKREGVVPQKEFDEHTRSSKEVQSSSGTCVVTQE